MKKYFVTMVALALTVSVLAQEDGGEYQPSDLDAMKAAMNAAKIHQDSIDTSSIVAVYDYECQTRDEDGKSVTDKMKICLLIGQHCTRCFPYRKFRKEREWAEGEERAGTVFLQLKKGEYMEGYDFGSDEELPMLKAESYCYVPQVWMNYPDRMMTLRDAIPPSIYEIREKRKPINWKLSDDTLTVAGYLCKTAICQLHGRKWTVRYSEDIPTSAGPWKLCGLPGLILEAEADGGIHRFKLADLSHTVAPIYYETNAITSKTSEKMLIKNRITTFGNRLYLMDPYLYITDYDTIDKVYVDNGMIINGTYVNNKPHVFQPLEY
ncbi:MAG: GLPGLI family protein [Bacteroidaceae bacterium]|nr:GLPGLI family protein [Bacteroidaceae bacterium]